MEQNERFLELKNRLDELEHQSLMILREHSILIEELKKVCPHEETSESFTMAPYSTKEMKVCNVCKKTLFHQEEENGWK